MMTTPTNFSVLCENGILIESNTNRFGLFDFSKINEIIGEGYKSAKEQISRVKVNVQRRISHEERAQKRKQFQSTIPDVLVDNVKIEGINSKQAEYVKQIIKPGIVPIPLKD